MTRHGLSCLSIPTQQESFHARTRFHCRATHIYHLVQGVPSPQSASASSALQWQPISNHTHSRFRSTPRGVTCSQCSLLCTASRASSCSRDLHVRFYQAGRPPESPPGSSWYWCLVFIFSTIDLTLALMRQGSGDITMVACLAVAIT